MTKLGNGSLWLTTAKYGGQPVTIDKRVAFLEDYDCAILLGNLAFVPTGEMMPYAGQTVRIIVIW